MNDEQKAKAEDLAKRIKAFNEDLIPLLGKHKVGLAAQPVILVDGRIAAKPHLFDDTPVEKTAEEVEPAPEKTTDLASA